MPLPIVQVKLHTVIQPAVAAAAGRSCCDLTLAWAAARAFLSDNLSSFEDLSTPHAPRFSASDGSG
jgi:hypothetical protein